MNIYKIFNKMKAIKQNRLKFELEDIKKYNQFSVKIDPNNNNVWYVSFKGADKTLYQNENFTLRFQFDDGYVIYINLYNIIIIYSRLKDLQ